MLEIFLFYDGIILFIYWKVIQCLHLTSCHSFKSIKVHSSLYVHLVFWLLCSLVCRATTLQLIFLYGHWFVQLFLMQWSTPHALLLGAPDYKSINFLSLVRRASTSSWGVLLSHCTIQTSTLVWSYTYMASLDTQGINTAFLRLEDSSIWRYVCAWVETEADCCDRHNPGLFSSLIRTVKQSVWLGGVTM